MAEVIKETVVTKRNSGDTVVAASTTSKATTTQTVEYLIYFVFGLLEILLGFRLVLKLMGANTASGFVRFIYGSTNIFIYPFEGIFRRGVSQGLETVSVLEPSTIVALVVYAVLSWGIVVLLRVLSGQTEPTE
jgi:hypothetical protein